MLNVAQLGSAPWRAGGSLPDYPGRAGLIGAQILWVGVVGGRTTGMRGGRGLFIKEGAPC